MRRDWESLLIYLPAYDAFYGGASDWGPGCFLAAYGEKYVDSNGDEMVKLYEADGGEAGDAPDMLTLRKSGDSWLIQSHLPQ